MDLSGFPRISLVPGPTPVEPLDGLSRHLGEAAKGVRIFVKRDDLGPVGLGGNKLRKLEFLIGAARQEHADTLITVGALQSNHARLTAAAAARHGFSCELFLTRSVERHDPDYTGSGNRLLDGIFGARIHELPGDRDSLAAAQARAEELRRAGRKAYVFPAGGSSPVGCLGYAACAREILAQSAALGIDFARIVAANGSSGTHAGLIAGFAAAGRDPRMAMSYAVLASGDETRATTLDKARQTLALIDPERSLSATDVIVDDRHRGPGYGVPTEAMLEAVRLLARSEGLLLDPVYSGKAFAGLLHDLRAGVYRPGEAVLFLMTGGVPGVFAYRSVFGDE